MTTALYQNSRIKRARATKAEVEERRKARWRRTSTSPSGVTPEQIAEWNLPTRPTKASDSRSKGFGNISVELDAIDPMLCAPSCRKRSSSISLRINSRY